MDDSPTELFLPSVFPYPIRVVSLDAQQHSLIVRGTRLLTYSFAYRPSEPRFGTWDSAIEGTLAAWNVNVGDVLSQRTAIDGPVALVLEPCKHGTQLAGLCVICGKDMTNIDYTGFSDASRASIQMTHSAFGPTVSLQEAQRIERESAEFLLKSRKLSLIVDLDQTIVHATVDPTVGEWIAEGEAWQARHPHNPPSPDQDECNPNWHALKDVRSFRLGPESFVSPLLRAPRRIKHEHNLVENDGCIYYIKPRPGWRDFLQQISTKYELHVYTMGTRSYAEEVCSAIDPDGSLFGGRILSRDESGSMTQKSLQRLFPCDTSMVVVIDDRADVWEWCPNLIKVIPYDFFVGIGDINSSFLPKIEPLTTTAPIIPPKFATSNGTPIASTSPEAGIDISPIAEEKADVAEIQATALQSQSNAVLDAQLEERPLAKKQDELQEHEVEEQKQNAQISSPVEDLSPPTKKALLKNDDHELIRIANLLKEVHSLFFAAYDQSANQKSGRSYDVTKIIPRLRAEVFEGVHILFSSVIPLDTNPETTEVWRLAHMFGARCSTELTSEITHVVAAKRGTVKVDMARRRGGIKIVWLAWFTDSIALWRKQDEKPYFLDDPPETQSPTQLASSNPMILKSIDNEHQIQSVEPDIELDDWDQEPPELKETGALELGSINWDDINDEVEAAMNESDDDDSDARSERTHGMRSGYASEDEFNTVSGNPQINSRKRPRSVTPSDSGAYGNSENDLLRSPLAKRKKLAAERMGSSKLKKGITADDFVSSDKETASNGSASGRGTPVDAPSPDPVAPLIRGSVTPKMEEDDDDTSDSSSDEDDEDDEDDFLARALEEDDAG